MNLNHPQPSCDPYPKRLYDFLQNPVFDTLRLNPRSLFEVGDAGVLYYNIDSGEFQVSGTNGTFSALGGGNYIQRTGGSGYDFTTSNGDFSTTGSWDDIDLSSIVGSNAFAVNIRLYTYDGSPNDQNVTKQILFSPYDLKPTYNNYEQTDTYCISHYGSNRRYHTFPLTMPLDGTRVISYHQQSGGAYDTIDTIEMAIMGWWVGRSLSATYTA